MLTYFEDGAYELIYLKDIIKAQSYQDQRFYLTCKGELYWSRYTEIRKYTIYETIIDFSIVIHCKMIEIHIKTYQCVTNNSDCHQGKKELKLMCYYFYPGIDETKILCCKHHKKLFVIKEKDYYYHNCKLYYYDNGCKIVFADKIIDIVLTKNRMYILHQDNHMSVYTCNLCRLKNEDLNNVKAICKNNKDLLILINGIIMYKPLECKSIEPFKPYEGINLEGKIYNIQSNDVGIFIYTNKGN
jgi:hypothetical protein